MLVSEEHVIEDVDVSEQDLERDPPGVHLRYNHTEPSVISDGIDFVAVIEESEDTYRIDYWGFSVGRLRVTPAGVKELGKRLAHEGGEIPSWTIDSKTVDADNPPSWVPDGTTLNPETSCDSCGQMVSVRDVVTPQALPADLDGDVFCLDCWEARTPG
jgi:hypothetical protein